MKEKDKDREKEKELLKEIMKKTTLNTAIIQNEQINTNSSNNSSHARRDSGPSILPMISSPIISKIANNKSIPNSLQKNYESMLKKKSR